MSGEFARGQLVYFMFAVLEYDVTQTHNLTANYHNIEINEVTLSSKDLPKAGKDQGDPTRKVNPPLSDAELDIFIYVLALLALLVSVIRSIST